MQNLEKLQPAQKCRIISVKIKPASRFRPCPLLVSDPLSLLHCVTDIFIPLFCIHPTFDLL